MNIYAIKTDDHRATVVCANDHIHALRLFHEHMGDDALPELGLSVVSVNLTGDVVVMRNFSELDTDRYVSRPAYDWMRMCQTNDTYGVLRSDHQPIAMIDELHPLNGVQGGGTVGSVGS